MSSNSKAKQAPVLKDFYQQIKAVRLLHQDELKKHLDALSKRYNNNQPIDQSLKKIALKITSSKAQVEALDQHCPIPKFPDELPISQRIDDISAAINNHQVVIIAGETGSGKTTQIPKICLKIGRGRKGKIAHTQPRRLAARTVSRRIAEELKVKLGEQVGYKIRFDDVSSDRANLIVMTDGMLLAELSSDPMLLAYDTLIIDEAHERSLNIDFLLGYLHRLLQHRPDLKLIITSATIDPKRFSTHFNNAPMIEVSGRTYPVEVRYRPLIVESESTDEEQNQFHREPLDAMADAVNELLIHGSGDVLVFLPGEREIRDAAGFLRKRFNTKLDVFPLYSRLSKNDQDKIFKSHSKRRIVLATNVAETSLTVPGIRYVIDTGVARISRYNQKSKLQQLPIESISRASADQRKGRCGRLEDGICIRLYSEDDYNLRKEFTHPEIHRTNLAAVILKMLDMGLGKIDQFPFVEPPEAKRITDGFRLLQNLQAINSKLQITKAGQKLAKLPVDPRFGKMLLSAEKYSCVKELLIIVSALSVQDIRERPLEKRNQADEFHRRFNTVNSDFIAILNLWRYCHHIRADISTSAFRKKISKEYLSFMRLRDWMETYRQLTSLCKQLGMRVNQQDADYATIHKCIITGMPDQLGNKSPEGDYLGARNSRFMLNRQSAVVTKKSAQDFQQLISSSEDSSQQVPSSKWVVAAELMETQNIYARQVAAIETQWVVEVVKPLVKHHYYDPFWSLRSGCCKAYLQQSLFGLILATKKIVNYEPIDKDYCRALFLKQGFLERQMNTKIPQIQNFWKACDEILQQEDKTRRRDRMLDSETIVELLETRIPKDIVSVGQLNKWYQQATTKQRQQLDISVDNLLRDDVTELPKLPQFWQLGDIQLPIKYKFEPGEDDDGMTVTVPLALLPSLENTDFEYLIPALLKQKIIALLKGLPKKLRKNFVPVPNFATSVLERIEDQASLQHKTQPKEKLFTAICRHLRQITGISLNISDLEAVVIPDQLRVNFNLINEHGKQLTQSRDLNDLKRRANNQNWQTKIDIPIQQSQHISETQLKFWPDITLLEAIEITQSGIKIKQYPAIEAQQTAVKLKYFSHLDEARYATQLASVQLLLLNIPRQIKFLKQQIPNQSKLSLGFASLGSYSDFFDDLCWCTVKFLIGPEKITNNQDFEAILLRVSGQFHDKAIALVAVFLPIFERKVSIQKQLKGRLSPVAIASYTHIASVLDGLIYPGFMRAITEERLDCYSNYLKSLMIRLEKLPHSANHERASVELLNHWNSKIVPLSSKVPSWSDESQNLQILEQMMDELCLSFFTQELKTSMIVSEKRLSKQYNSLVLRLG